MMSLPIVPNRAPMPKAHESMCGRHSAGSSTWVGSPPARCSQLSATVDDPCVGVLVALEVHGEQPDQSVDAEPRGRRAGWRPGS